MNGNEESPDDLEDTRSPTINPISLLTALSIAAHYPKCEISTYDAISAFAELEVYDHQGTLFFYLTKFMYGLAEAARAFYDRVHGILVSLGFKRSEVDEGLFVKKVDGTQQVHTVCLHVDDILSLAPNTDARKALGLVIKRTKTGDISVSQIGYTQDIR